MEDGEGDLVITDVVMPDENGLDLIPRIRRIRPELKVVVMSAQSTLMTAVKAAQRGAFEYLPKPFDLKELLAVVGRALAAPMPLAAPAEPRDAEERLPLIGRSVAMQEIYRTIARLTTADLTVMVNGESGTGKELVARALHDYGRRRAAPFVAINMAAIPRELIESELFGHERRLLHRRHNRNQGRFEQAHGGTLFLDEIGDMPPEAQTRLLRVLQEGEFTPSAAAADQGECAHRRRHPPRFAPGDPQRPVPGGFVLPAERGADRLPPLRERTEDIPVLARHFLDRAREMGLPGKLLDQGGDRSPAQPSLARQRARTREPDAAPGGPLSAGDDRRGSDQRELAESGLEAEPHPAPCRVRAAGDGGGAAHQAVPGRHAGRHADARHLRPGDRRGGAPADPDDAVGHPRHQIKAAAMLGLNRTRCARRSATWKSRSCAASARR